MESKQRLDISQKSGRNGNKEMRDFENLTEKKVASTEIFDGQVLHVYKDDIELPNGKPATR